MYAVNECLGGKNAFLRIEKHFRADVADAGVFQKHFMRAVVLADEGHEGHVVGVFFDSAGRYVATEYLADGTVNSSSFLPRKVMDISARLGASGVILAHNHPRGIAKPSDADVITTASMASVSDAMGIKFMGHYVIAGFDHALCMETKK